jgi:hypothetical protein
VCEGSVGDGRRDVENLPSPSPCSTRRAPGESRGLGWWAVIESGDSQQERRENRVGWDGGPSSSLVTANNRRGTSKSQRAKGDAVCQIGHSHADGWGDGVTTME